MTPGTFCLIAGIVYCGLGVLGFLPQAAPNGLLLGIFRTSAALALIHLATGLWGLAAWAWVSGPVSYARAMAIVYGALTVLALGWAPFRGHDVWLHGVSALAAAYFGWLFLARPPASRALRPERRGNVAERRHATAVVAYERRRGAADRRLGAPSSLPAG